MNRFDIINRIGDRYRIGNTETGEFSYAQALKTVGKDIKDYQKATTGTQHKFLDLRFENERLAVLVECKNKFSRWDKAKIQSQLQDYVRFEKAYSDKKICDFMSKAVGVNKNSRVLDPCCGSGAFLVRAMTDAMDDCDTEEEREEVKKNQIFGIEYEEGAFGLSSTNMLIHGDGNSNVVQDSMFKRAKWIADNNIIICQ